ncbi:MAG: right-handed parallel beta-helix repeat-containing protein, partial [candidate division SR1 bacterium]|nr:right-handed parallel beta-helix repeat-containing protein [candidate division SR1 bacterium]
MNAFSHIHHHIKKHHKTYILGTAIGGIGFFAVKAIVFLVSMLGVLNASGTYALGEISCGDRDNTQLLTQGFREGNPDNNKIMCAVLGDESNRAVYTKDRTTMGCVTGDISITGISAGLELPNHIPANTFYVLESGNYTTSGDIVMENCSALLGKGEVKIQTDAVTGEFLTGDDTSNRIVDNVEIVGQDNISLIVTDEVSSGDLGVLGAPKTLSDIAISSDVDKDQTKNNSFEAQLPNRVNSASDSTDVLTIRETKDIMKYHGFKENTKGEMVGKESLDFNQFHSKVAVDTLIQSLDQIENKSVEVKLPEGTNIQNGNDEGFTGVLQTPEIIDEKSIHIPGQEIFSAVKIGENNQSLILQDSGGNDVYATVQIPTPDLEIGKDVVINYSEDGINWNHLTDASITGIAGETYVIFKTNHFTTFTVGTITWDNLKFIDQSFRDANPTTGMVIKALYGSGLTDTTAYNKYRTGNCQATGVVYVQPYSISGINSIPTPAANTVYVLNSGSYIMAVARVFAGNCTAIVGKGNVKIYSTGAIANTFTTTSRINVILDNLKFDGYLTSTGAAHTAKNTVGVLLTTCASSTLNNIQLQNHAAYGINVVSSSNILLNNIIAHSNASYGILVSAGSPLNTNIIINSATIFNNATGGIGFNANFGSINNSHVFNNAGTGMSSSTGNSNLIANTQIYNNLWGGLAINRFSGAVSNAIIKDVEIFNNGGQGWSMSGATNNKIYDSIKIYGNATSDIF